MIKKRTKKPLVSIIIPTYNSLKTIEKCLTSIKRQNYKNKEIIVVDSPFYDKKKRVLCKKIIKKYAKYFLDGPERSIQRNRGIKEAKGEYILVVDQDMYLSKDIIPQCLAKFNNNRYIALTIPEISIGEGFWTKCVALDRYITTVLEKGSNECCRFFKKKDAFLVGGYDETIVGAEDAQFTYKMEQKGKIGKIKSIIYHDEGKTEFWKRVKKKYYYSKAFREFFRRHPASAVINYFPLKIAYIKHWRILVKKPLITCGMICLRSFEVTAGILGVLFSNYETTKR